MSKIISLFKYTCRLIFEVTYYSYLLRIKMDNVCQLLPWISWVKQCKEFQLFLGELGCLLFYSLTHCCICRSHLQNVIY